MRITSCLTSVLASLLVLAASTSPVKADIDPHERLKKHVRDVVQKVKAAPTAAKKRAILDEELRTMITALNRAERMSAPSSSDKAAIESLRSRLQEKLDELHGRAGYEAVPNGQLDAFADYVQQDFEQAGRTVTLTVTTALLILILIILLV